MAQTDYQVTIDIVRPHRTKTGSGTMEDWAVPPATKVASAVKASMHFYSRQSTNSVENRGSAAGGAPGQMSVTDRFFRINKPFPAEVKVGDRIIVSGGSTFRVGLPERRYSRTLQIDVELVG